MTRIRENSYKSHCLHNYFDFVKLKTYDNILFLLKETKMPEISTDFNF